MDWKALAANYKPVDTTYQPPQQDQPHSGGLGGLLSGIVSSVTHPVGKFFNQALLEGGNLYNTARMAEATHSHNAEAFNNANRAAQNTTKAFGDSGGLFNAGTITTPEETKQGAFGTGARKIGGTTAELESMLIPGGEGIGGKALNMGAAGALYGGGQSFAERNGQDALKSTLMGGLAGGAIGGAGGVLGKIAGKVAGRGEAGAAGGLSERLANKGQILESKAGGINMGEKIGNKTITPEDSQAMTDWLTTKGLAGKSAPEIYRGIGDVKATAANGMSDAVTKATQAGTVIGDAEKQHVANTLLEEAHAIPGVDKEKAIAHAQAYAKDIENANTPEDLLNLKRNLDAQINYNRNSASVEPVVQQTAQTARTHINQLLNAKVPELTQHNADFAMASRMEPFVAKAAKAPKGVKLPFVGGINGDIGGGLRQATQAKVGGVLQKFGGAAKTGAQTGVETAAQNTVKSRIAGALKASPLSPSKALTLGATNELNQPQAPEQPMPPGSSTIDNQLADVINAGGQQQADQSQYGIQNMMQDVQNDPKHATTYMAMYKMLNPDGGGQSAEQQKQAEASSRAENILQGVLTQFQDLGGGQGRVGGFLASLEGRAGLNNKVNAYNQTKTDSAIALAKALTGSARVPEGLVTQIKDSLPSINDNPQEAQLKVQLMMQRIQQATAAVPRVAPAPSSDLTSLLAGTGIQ